MLLVFLSIVILSGLLCFVADRDALPSANVRPKALAASGFAPGAAVAFPGVSKARSHARADAQTRKRGLLPRTTVAASGEIKSMMSSDDGGRCRDRTCDILGVSEALVPLS